jgi:hypothetical protein
MEKKFVRCQIEEGIASAEDIDKGMIQGGQPRHRTHGVSKFSRVEYAFDGAGCRKTSIKSWEIPNNLLARS